MCIIKGSRTMQSFGYYPSEGEKKLPRNGMSFSFWARGCVRVAAGSCDGLGRPARVCLFVCLCVCPGPAGWGVGLCVRDVGRAGSNPAEPTPPIDSEYRDLHFCRGCGLQFLDFKTSRRPPGPQNVSEGSTMGQF